MPNGSVVSICAGSTMDNQILRELFTNTIEAAGILGVDSAFAAELAAKRDRLMLRRSVKTAVLWNARAGMRR